MNTMLAQLCYFFAGDIFLLVYANCIGDKYALYVSFVFGCEYASGFDLLDLFDYLAAFGEDYSEEIEKFLFWRNFENVDVYHKHAELFFFIAFGIRALKTEKRVQTVVFALLFDECEVVSYI